MYTPIVVESSKFSSPPAECGGWVYTFLYLLNDPSTWDKRDSLLLAQVSAGGNKGHPCPLFWDWLSLTDEGCATTMTADGLGPVSLARMAGLSSSLRADSTWLGCRDRFFRWKSASASCDLLPGTGGGDGVGVDSADIDGTEFASSACNLLPHTGGGDGGVDSADIDRYDSVI
jgi:hypothetical protein